MEYRWEAVWSVFRGDGALKQDIDRVLLFGPKGSGRCEGGWHKDLGEQWWWPGPQEWPRELRGKEGQIKKTQATE